MKSYLTYAGPGVYSPTVEGQHVHWQRDLTGNPLMGVYVPHVLNAWRFATVRVDGDLLRKVYDSVVYLESEF